MSLESSPVEGVAGVIIKFVNGQFDSVVGVSNSPVHAAAIADQFSETDKAPNVLYKSETVKMFVEHAV